MRTRKGRSGIATSRDDDRNAPRYELFRSGIACLVQISSTNADYNDTAIISASVHIVSEGIRRGLTSNSPRTRIHRRDHQASIKFHYKCQPRSSTTRDLDESIDTYDVHIVYPPSANLLSHFEDQSTASQSAARAHRSNKAVQRTDTPSAPARAP
jgi:hypothetical protein